MIKTKVVKPISHGLIIDWEEARSKADKLENQIVKRLDYIINTICETFKIKLITWYFVDAPEGSVGSLTFDGSFINFVCELYRQNDEMIIIDRDGDDYVLDGGIPTRWLFENFKTELTNGKKKYEDREAAHIAESLSDKKATKKLAAMAKKKLSKEELEALKQSL